MLPPRRNVWPPPPPAAESEADRLARVDAEREAKRVRPALVDIRFSLSDLRVCGLQVSNAIDEALALEREQKRRPSNAKILLLGLCYFCLKALNSKCHSRSGRIW
jgi:hypothetical protein